MILMTFWQGLAIAFFVRIGFIRGSGTYTANNVALAAQDLMICLEMPLFAIMHAYAFPWTDYDDSRLSSRLAFLFAVRDVLGVKDIIQDTYHTFVGTTFRRAVQLRDDADIWNDIYDEDGDLLDRHLRLPSDTCSLEFPECEDPEVENDYAQSRKLEFGDYNFPVMHSDPRFANPPAIQTRILNDALNFNKRIENESKELLDKVWSDDEGGEAGPSGSDARDL